MNDQDMQTKHYFYIHRIKGKLDIVADSSFSKENLFFLKSDEFKITESKIKYMNFQTGESYSPFSVEVKDKDVMKHWAFIDPIKNKLHIDCEMPEKLIAKFKQVLKENDVEIELTNIKYSYVEICCRYNQPLFNTVVETIKRLVTRLNTLKTHIPTYSMRDGDLWQYVIVDLFFEKYLNLKTYSYIFKYFSSITHLDKSRKPKIEIQIKEPENLEKAKEIGIPILKAIVNYLGIATTPMDQAYELDEYTYVEDEEKYNQNDKIFEYLKDDIHDRLPDLPDVVVADKTLHKITSYMWYQGKCKKELKEDLKLSESTIDRVFRKLGQSIEKRGDNKTGFIYFIDRTKLTNICNSYVPSLGSSNTSRNNITNRKHLSKPESNPKQRENSNPSNLPSVSKNIHSQKLIVQKPTKVQFSHR